MIGIKVKSGGKVKDVKAKAKAAKTSGHKDEKKEDADGKFKVKRQEGQVISDDPAEDKDHIEEHFDRWNCRGRIRRKCRIVVRWLKTKARHAYQACTRNFAKEVRNIGVEKTPTFKRLARIHRLAGLSVHDLRVKIRGVMDAQKKKLFGEPVVDHFSKKKKKITTGQRVIQKPNGKDGFSLASFVIHNESSIVSYFELDETDPACLIGAGGCSTVFKAAERQTHIMRAVKRITKKDVGEEEFLRNEVAVMKKMDHPNIPKLFEIFEDEKHLYLVMELCEGGDLLDKLLESSHMAEPQAGIVARTLLAATNYMHVHSIVHRDLKPENMLLKDPFDPVASQGLHDITPSNIRVTDFGFARSLPEDPAELMYTKVGSPYYIAPEILHGQGYTKASDLWSIGTIIYLLLCGYPPFAGNTDAETLDMVKKGDFVFPKEHWKIISRPAKHLIAHLMEVDPSKRISLKRALEHPWIRAKGVHKLEKMREETVDRLITFHKHHSLRKAAMLAIGFQLEAHDLVLLRDLYHSLDLNGDGLLQRAEFMKGVMSCGVDEVFVQEMIRSVDADQSGFVDYTEFVAATLERDQYVKNFAACLRAFRSFDQDDSGQLSMEEIAEILDMTTVDNQQEVEHFFDVVDLNKDGVMDFGEFHNMLEVEIEARRDRSSAMMKKEEEEAEMVDEEEFDTHIEGHDKELNVTKAEADHVIRKSVSRKTATGKSGKKGKHEDKPNYEPNGEVAHFDEAAALVETEVLVDVQVAEEEEAAVAAAEAAAAAAMKKEESKNEIAPVAQSQLD